jgi:hypothetical protein
VTRVWPDGYSLLPHEEALRQAEDLMAEFPNLYPNAQVVRTALRGMRPINYLGLTRISGHTRSTTACPRSSPRISSLADLMAVYGFATRLFSSRKYEQCSRGHAAFTAASPIWAKSIPLPFLLASAPLSERVPSTRMVSWSPDLVFGERAERVQGETIERIPVEGDTSHLDRTWVGPPRH